MRKLLFLHLCPFAITTADVCSRLYTVRAEIPSLTIQPRISTDVYPYCDQHDICVGIVVDGKYLPCQEAFVILTRHTERELDLPPILMPSPSFPNAVLTDYQNSLSDRNNSRDISELGEMPPELSNLMVSFELAVRTVAWRSAQLFPRLFYDNNVDGALFGKLRELTDAMRAILHASNLEIRFKFAKYIHRSFWVRSWTSGIDSMIRYVAQNSLTDMELIISSIAPSVHAFFYCSIHLGIDYRVFMFPTDLFWILTALAKFHPLYTDDPMWVLPRSVLDACSIDVRVGADIDWEHFQEMVWMQPLSKNSTHFETLFLRIVRMLMNSLRHWNSSSHSVLRRPETQSRIKTLQMYAYTVRYIGESTNVDTVDAETMDAVNTLLSSKDSLAVQIGHLTISTLLRLTRSRINPQILWGFAVQPQVRMRLCDRSERLTLTYLAPGKPNLRDFVLGILSLDRYRLMQLEPIKWVISMAPGDTVGPKSIFEIYRDFLAMFLETAMLTKISNTSDSYYVLSSVHYGANDNPFQIAFGRLLGILLRTKHLRALLVSCWTRSQPTSLFETIFFGSHFVRKGVYDVLPHGVLEIMFPDAHALVNSLSL